MMTHIGTEIALEHWMKDWKKYSAAHCDDDDVGQIDDLLMRSIQRGEMHMPAIGTYTKIARNTSHKPHTHTEERPQHQNM